MNTLLIFFAFPVATIILSVVLQKLIKSPILVAAIFFAIYLVIAFAFFDATFLVAAIIYTLLAYLTALIVKLLCHICRFLNNEQEATATTITVNTTQPVNNNVNGCNCCRRRRNF